MPQTMETPVIAYTANLILINMLGSAVQMEVIFGKYFVSGYLTWFYCHLLIYLPVM